MSYPLAIDYRFPLTVEHHAAPLPPLREGLTRIFASDWTHLNVYRPVPAVVEEVTIPAVMGTRELSPVVLDEAGNVITPAITEPYVVEPERKELVETSPATQELVRAGVCVRHDQLAAEWAASRPKPDDTEQYRAAMISALANVRYNAEVGGFDFRGKRVMSDRESQAKIQGLMVGVQLLGDAFKTSWKCEGGEWLDLDKNGALSLVGAALTHVSRLYTREAELSARIKAAATKDEITAIAQEGFE